MVGGRPFRHYAVHNSSAHIHSGRPFLRKCGGSEGLWAAEGSKTKRSRTMVDLLLDGLNPSGSVCLLAACVPLRLLWPTWLWRVMAAAADGTLDRAEFIQGIDALATWDKVAPTMVI